MKEKMPQEGDILIAEPFMKDYNFMRSVVYMAQTDTTGAIGFILNKKLGQTLGDLMNEMKGSLFPVFYGGPVKTDTIHFLHSRPDLIEGGELVGANLYWGGDFDLVIDLVATNRLSTNEIKFFLGQSGWNRAQLKQEMIDNSWLLGHADNQLIFQLEDQSIWQQAVRHLGKKYEPIIHYPIDPQLN